MVKKVISEKQAETYRKANEWADAIHKSQVEKGLRPSAAEDLKDGDIVAEVEKIVVEVSEKTKTKIEGNFMVPPRNTIEEIRIIVDTIISLDPEILDPEILDLIYVNETLVENENIWCLHDECIESIEPFQSEEELKKHKCECHLIDPKKNNIIY